MKKILSLIMSGILFGVVAGGTMIGMDLAKDRYIPSKTEQIEVTTPSTEANTEAEKKEQAQKTSQVNNGLKGVDVTQIVQEVMPCVVSITCTVQNTNYFYGTTESQGAGSGFIIAKDKEKLYIGTNNHVVNGATSLTVGFIDGSTAEAEVVGTDKDADLAVISVKAELLKDETAKEIKIAILGDSDALQVGETVVAIGNALGYGQSVTTGVISAKNREISFTDGSMTLLQTDAAINPGNSGGVLINTKGEVIGVNNAKLADTEVEGMGYAIPMSTAKGILTDLMNTTAVKEGNEAFLGVVGKNIDATYSQALGIPSGIYVSQVVEGSPAEKAGISAGDVITHYEGSQVSSMEGLKEKISRKSAGTKIKLTLQRSNQNGQYEEKEVEVTLGKRSDFANEEVDNNSNNQQQYPQGGNGQQPYQDDEQNGQYFDPFEFFFGNGGSNGYYR